MQQNKVIKNIFYLAILTTAVVVTWVASNVWYSLVTPTTPEDTNQYTIPIVATFDTETLEELGNRIQVPVNLSEQGNYLTDPGKKEIGTPSAEITITPQPEITQPVIEEVIENQPIILEPDQPLEQSEEISPTPEEAL